MRNMLPPDADDFDDMLHALGRPKRANADCYRNYYCLSADSEQAQRFEALGWWDFMRRINGGRDAIYSVNGNGKQALAEWMTTISTPARGLKASGEGEL